MSVQENLGAGVWAGEERAAGGVDDDAGSAGVELLDWLGGTDDIERVDMSGRRVRQWGERGGWAVWHWNSGDCGP